MKRILIIALASIFLVNMLAIIPKAEIIFENGTINEGQTQIQSNGQILKVITGGYIIEQAKEYNITINIPLVNEQIINKFDITGAYNLTIISVDNNNITIEDENVTNVIYQNNQIKFNLKNTSLRGTVTNRKLGIRLNDIGTVGQTVNVSVNNPIITVEQIEKTIGDILIENVSNAPKDVLRDVISILPVLLTVLIAYIATRKGISFIRSILESA